MLLLRYQIQQSGRVNVEKNALCSVISLNKLHLEIYKILLRLPVEVIQVMCIVFIQSDVIGSFASGVQVKDNRVIHQFIVLV